MLVSQASAYWHWYSTGYDYNNDYVMNVLHETICVFSGSSTLSLISVFEDDLLALDLLYPWRLICEHVSLSYLLVWL